MTTNPLDTSAKAVWNGGEHHLPSLLHKMSPQLKSGVFVYCFFANARVPSGLRPLCSFEEDEGTTAILLKSDATAQGLPYSFECQLITLTVHSDLEAVGFLAIVTALLAKHDIPCNVVSGYLHDHLLVPVGRSCEAIAILNAASF